MKFTTQRTSQLFSLGGKTRMKIHHLIFFALFAFKALAGDTNAPSNPILQKYVNAAGDKIAGRWFEIVDSMPVRTPPPRGQIVMSFRIFQDGHISDLKTVSTNAVDESLIAPCKRAVLDSAPFAIWSKEMRQVCTNGFCIMRFTFVYK
jgi:hypothetical protein